jgi:hypothetical protein
MKNKKPLAIGLAAVAAAGALLAWRQQQSAPSMGEATPAPSGIVNPDKSDVGLTTKPAPQLSNEKFAPPPSMGVGSYTDPAIVKAASVKATPK